MTDLERLELALRNAFAEPNPHNKAMVVLRELLDQLLFLNEYHRSSELDDLKDLRRK